jgi:hypothetical protein
MFAEEWPCSVFMLCRWFAAFMLCRWFAAVFANQYTRFCSVGRLNSPLRYIHSRVPTRVAISVCGGDCPINPFQLYLMLRLPFLLLFCALTAFTMTVSGCNDDDDAPLPREVFLGAYNVNENCGTFSRSYPITITESSNNNTSVVINNLGDQSFNVRATVNGANLDFNDTQEGITFSGSGNLSGNTLSMVFSVSQTQPSGLFNCVATGIKQ